MKLLFDQNISHRVLNRLASIFPEAKHVRDFNLQFAKDREIWTFAKENGYSIVTQNLSSYYNRNHFIVYPWSLRVPGKNINTVLMQ